MARQRGSRTGRWQGCNHLQRARTERLLAAGASIKGAARKFAIDYHALRRHWRNHVSAEARAAHIAGAGASKDQLEEIVADEYLALIDHYRIVRGALYKGFGAASELGDGNSLALLAGRLHENFRDCGRLTGELQRGPRLNIQNNVLINPDYARVIARIVSAVAPYPEAREAVIAALRDLDATSASAPALMDRRGGGAAGELRSMASSFAAQLADALETSWPAIARRNQLPPPGDWWQIWLLLAGRGFGKTRTLAEWVCQQTGSGQATRIALVAATAADARDVLVEGESGILAVAPPWFRPVYESSKRRLTWPNGALATTFSAEEPERLRGPQHDAAVCDELGSWARPETWDILQFGLRRGRNPASRPFPWFPEKVPSPNDQQTLSVAARTAIACRSAGQELGESF